MGYVGDMGPTRCTHLLLALCCAHAILLGMCMCILLCTSAYLLLHFTTICAREMLFPSLPIVCKGNLEER